MRILSVIAGIAVVVLPEIIRAIDSERARSSQREEAEIARKYDADQRDMDRKNAAECARIGVGDSCD